MQIEEFEVKFFENPATCDLSIYLISRHSGKTYLAQTGPLVFSQIEEYAWNPEPTFRIPNTYRDAFLKGFAEALDEKGVKTDSDARLQGTIEALRAHMSDLRKLLKLEKRK